MYSGQLLGHVKDASHGTELRFRSAICLALIEGLLVDLILESFGRGCSLKDFILAEGEEAFKDVFCELKTDDVFLPRETWAIT